MRHVIFFTVLVVAFCLSAVALGADPTSSSSNSTGGASKLDEDMGRENEYVLLAGLTPEVQEKKRVPKPEKEKRKQDDQDDDDDDDDSCMGAIFEGILMSICHGDDDDQEQASAVALTPEPHTEELDRFEVFVGLIDPLDPEAEDMTLWSIPGGEVLGAEVVERFPRGTRVEVLDSRVLANTEWFRVMGSDPYPFSGWILAQDMVKESAPAPGVAEEPEPAHAAPEGLTPTTPREPTSTYAEIATPSLGRPTWQILADFSWAGPNEELLNEEYKSGGFRSAVRLRMCPIASFQFGFGVSHSHADGKPQYNYKLTYTEGDVDSSRDIPSDSDIKILALEFHAGQYFPFSADEGPSYFAWSIGPTVFRVEESAQISVVEFTGDAVTRQYERRDELKKWRVGGDARLELCYMAGGQVPIGLNVGLSVIPWKAKYDESLTLDWIEGNVFVLFYAGLTLGYSFF